MNRSRRFLISSFVVFGFAAIIRSAFAQYSPSCGKALIAFFHEISPEGETKVPDHVTKTLHGSALSYSQSIKIFAVDVETHPELYEFWHEENAQFLFGDPNLLRSPTSDFYIVSISRPASSSYHCRLNWDSHEIEAVYWIPEG